MASQDIKIVETANFSEVVKHFDENGKIIDENTRFKIECSICRDKILALTNPKFDQRSESTHETYAVLHQCGHAFGYRCLRGWMNSQHTPTCPICRQRIFVEAEEGASYVDWILMVFGFVDIEEQLRDILAIREILNTGRPHADDLPHPTSIIMGIFESFVDLRVIEAVDPTDEQDEQDNGGQGGGLDEII